MNDKRTDEGSRPKRARPGAPRKRARTCGHVQPAPKSMGINGGAIDLERLPSLSIAALRRLWAEHMGRASPPAQKRLLVRELAWRVQERAHGGLDAETRRLLAIASRSAIATGSAARGSRLQPKDGTSTPTRRPRGDVSTARAAARDLPPTTRLVRTWRGITHEVHVLDGGRHFRYRDQTYRSLSEIAREITGTRWSGPRFFGLTTRASNDDGIVPRSKPKRPRPTEGGSS